MEISYQYTSPSVCVQSEDYITLGLSPDLTRDEKVSFVGRLKHPLIFRDAMLMLREIVISDSRIRKKDYSDFFAWFNQEIEKRMIHKEGFLKTWRKELQGDMDKLKVQLDDVDINILEIRSKIMNLKSKVNDMGIWHNYNKIESQFWHYIRNRDQALWYVLDPVITVHPDQVSFEAFSLDESVYGCLAVKMDEFEIKGTPKLGTTNVDFSIKLAKEMERFRTYNEVELSINPEGITVDSGVTPEYMEKKIDLPESWIKGFNQVSAAASLDGFEIELTPVDLYDICSFLRRNKARKSPRAMKWVFEPKKRVKIIFEPWEKELELSTIYTGKRKHIERIWGRRRWLIVEKIIPISKSFKLKLFGFGMPHFLVADLGFLNMTIGFTSWSSNDWVKGTAFNIMGGFIGEGDPNVRNILKENRVMALETLKSELSSASDQEIRASIGSLFRKGEAYFDLNSKVYRYRQLLNIPLPRELYETTQLERDVLNEINKPEKRFNLRLTANFETIAESSSSETTSKRYQHRDKTFNTVVTLDQDKQIVKVNCGCKAFKRGPRNISAPCKHILALYINASTYLELPLIPNRRYDKSSLEAMRVYD